MRTGTWVFISLAGVTLIACAGSKKDGSAIQIAPQDATMLTCTSRQFSAGGADVSWSASAGTIDATGQYTAPRKIGPDAVITAAEKADSSVSASMSVKLETADVGDKRVIADNFTAYPDVWAHGIAASGNTLYAAWGNTPSSGVPQVLVARSDDGGQTWAAPVVASPAIRASSAVSCVSAAVDAGNPNVVYAVFNFDAGSGLPGPYSGVGTADDAGLGLVVSTDGGRTWPTFKILESGNSADSIHVQVGICPDVASPKADVVAVTTPGGSYASIFLWVDQARGSGFGIAAADQYNMMATEELPSLHAIAADVAQNGGYGDTTEAPQLFTDGKGKLCVTYVAGTPSGSSSPSSAVWVQCSRDLGQTFSNPTIPSPTFSYSQVRLGHPTGAFAPNGDIAVAWRGFGVETATGGATPIAAVALSADGAATWKDISAPVYQDANGGLTNAAGIGDIAFDGAGTLWRTYVLDNGIDSRIAIDKTCDLGATWSGAQVVNPSGDATLPEVVAAANGRVAVFAKASGTVGVSDQMRLYSVAP